MKYLLLLAALPGLMLAQSLEGTWQGTLMAPGNRELRTVIKIVKDGAAMKGTLYSIDQGGAQIPISAATLQGTTVKMTVPGIGGSYDGKMEAGGNAITGAMSQGRIHCRSHLCEPLPRRLGRFRRLRLLPSSCRRGQSWNLKLRRSSRVRRDSRGSGLM